MKWSKTNQLELWKGPLPPSSLLGGHSPASLPELVYLSDLHWLKKKRKKRGSNKASHYPKSQVHQTFPSACLHRCARRVTGPQDPKAGAGSESLSEMSRMMGYPYSPCCTMDKASKQPALVLCPHPPAYPFSWVSSCYPFDLLPAGSSVHLSTWLHAVQSQWQYLGRKAETWGYLDVRSYCAKTDNSEHVWKAPEFPLKATWLTVQ